MALLTQTREAVLAQGLRGEGATGAVETLFSLLSDFALSDAIGLAMGDGRKLKAVLSDIPAAKANLRQLVGTQTRGSEAILDAMLSERLVSGADVTRLLSLASKTIANRFGEPRPAGAAAAGLGGRVPDRRRKRYWPISPASRWKRLIRLWRSASRPRPSGFWASWKSGGPRW